MRRFEIAPEVEQNTYLAPLVRQTEPAVAAFLGATVPTATARWWYQLNGGQSELTLTVTDGERQSELAFRANELTANGAFRDRLGEIKDALDHHGIWVQAVRDLIANAREWCKDLPDAVLTEDTVSFFEERSGRYSLPRLTVDVGKETMWVVPVAGWAMTPTWVEWAPGGQDSRAVGRLDMRGGGGGGDFSLYYILPENAWAYKVQWLDLKAEKYRFGLLDRTVFVCLARECMDLDAESP